MTVTDEEYEIIKDLRLDDVSNWDDDTQVIYEIIEKYINTDDVFQVEEEFISVQVKLEK